MKPDFVFLFDTTGYAAEPFTKLGYKTLIIDILNVGQYAHNTKATWVLDWDILKRQADIIELCQSAHFVFGFPPCDDMAVSGARHFDAKGAANPWFQEQAIHLMKSVERIGDVSGKPWAAENPGSIASTWWRSPNFRFHPYMYGGYLPEDDIHPDYPRFIAPRDAYTKKTNLWTGNGFEIPKRLPVEPEIITNVSGIRGSRQFIMLGGKSEKTKRIRSASPRGFFNALALYWHYKLNPIW